MLHRSASRSASASIPLGTKNITNRTSIPDELFKVISCVFVLADVSDFFFIFCFRGGEREEESEAKGGILLFGNRERGASEGCTPAPGGCRGGGGERFFSGRNVHQVVYTREVLVESILNHLTQITLPELVANCLGNVFVPNGIVSFRVRLSLKGDGTKVTERAQKADSRRKLQIFADSPLLPEIQAFGGGRKPQIFTENRRTPQIGLRHLRCITFSSALIVS